MSLPLLPSFAADHSRRRRADAIHQRNAPRAAVPQQKTLEPAGVVIIGEFFKALDKNRARPFLQAGRAQNHWKENWIMNLSKAFACNENMMRVDGTPESPLFVAADICQVFGIGLPEISRTGRYGPDRGEQL